MGGDGPLTLLISGAGGHGCVLADAAESAGYERILFVDPKYRDGGSAGPWPILQWPEDYGRLRSLVPGTGSVFAICGVGGAGDIRRRENEALSMAGFTVPVIRHPSATVSRHARIGAGTMIFAGAIVNFGAEIGGSVILNTSCSVDHDCRIADGALIAPGARLAGGVHVGEDSWIGIGASVRQGVRIGRGCMVGAGAAVVSDVPDGATVMGVPARIREA
jgi:sugar O-acyltransferase (sialic acid O-acetyltransferase NeuD family)